mgnify:CR=1 FL=1
MSSFLHSRIACLEVQNSGLKSQLAKLRTKNNELIDQLGFQNSYPTNQENYTEQTQQTKNIQSKRLVALEELIGKFNG